MSDKTILEQWRAMAYDQQADRNKLQQFWAAYFNIEKGIYEQLLSNPDEVVSGTVKELAEKYGQDVLTMVGFLDGINDSLVIPNPIEEMEEDTEVNLDSIRPFFIKIWLRPALTGCMSWKSGTIFLMRRREKRFTRSRSLPQLS